MSMMMSTADQMLGPIYGSSNTGSTPAAHAAPAAAPRETPGPKGRLFQVLDDPTTWLVLSLALAMLAANYSATGELIG